ncbi:MAG: PQQ-dependent sugar dehydrogenase, partial [Burkholderiales bacterium]
TPSGYPALKLEPVVAGLSSPLYVTSPPGDPRLFVVEQGGQIRVVQNGVLNPAPYLDISQKISGGGERGLLGMAFDPQYAASGNFYVCFTAQNGDITVERFRVSANDANVADVASTPVISVPHSKYPNHNGGQIAFGPDGYLYIGTGDGGGGGDPLGNGQNGRSLLGKILRIDVSALPYKIPPANPYAASSSRAGEIWAYGLRNPWRFSFDAAGGKLYIGDVGQSAREEINVADVSAAGLNYGWNITEGTVCYNATSCDKTGITMPVVDHAHPDAVSVTGGYVYRGSKIPELRGAYFYGDFANGWVKSFRFANGAATEQADWPSLKTSTLASFGVDSDGEIYLVSLAGNLYRIARN